jgi:hypothetical protein
MLYIEFCGDIFSARERTHSIVRPFFKGEFVPSEEFAVCIEVHLHACKGLTFAAYFFGTRHYSSGVTTT